MRGFMLIKMKQFYFGRRQGTVFCPRCPASQSSFTFPLVAAATDLSLCPWSCSKPERD